MGDKPISFRDADGNFVSAADVWNEKKLEELFNSETFIPTTNQKICENCPYNQLCGQK